jgi:fatty-acyl-CoA synthase
MQLPKFEVGKTTIGQLVDLVAEQFGDSKALMYHKLGIDHTYREFRDVCNQVAKGFMALGVQKGDKVAIWANNVPEWLYTQFGTPKIGAIMVTVNTAYRSFELEYLMKQSDSQTLILIGGVRTPDEYVKVIYDVCPELKDSEPGKLKCAKLPELKNVVYLGKEKLPGMFNWEDIIALGQKVSDAELKARQDSLDPDDVINMQYTSGTTGFPKGVMLTHTNIIGNAKSIAACMNLSSKDNLCIPVPFFHCFGCVLGVLAAVTHAATMVLLETFDPVAVMASVEEERCTALYGVPTMFIAVLQHKLFKKFDFGTLRTGIMAGSPCPIEVMRQVIDQMNMTEITICYGLTEASPVITQTRADDDIRLRVESVGRAMPGIEVKIVDPETHEVLPSGQQGEVCCRGYNVMKGYYNMPEATAEAIDADGWLHSGDLGVMDADGYLAITGRHKDMIIRGGENIYPREIEEFLYRLDGIADVQVAGVPSEKYGEEVGAFIVLKEGRTYQPEDIRDFCRGQISHYKIPKYVAFVNDYPMTASGKIQKYKLREMAEELFPNRI